MGDLISAVTNLCKLLECLVNTYLKPDFFRLSKRNNLGFDQVKHMWEVIHKICCFSGKNMSCSDDSYQCIESYLRKQGSIAVYFLSPDATARQLLICFGFLLLGRIIENNIEKVLMETPLGEELPSFMIKPETIDDLVEDLAIPDEDDPQTLLNYALYVSGKVKHNLRAIANYRQEKVQLFYKVHRATAGTCGSTHLCVGDLLMTVRPELQLEFLSKCQHCVPLLQAYFKWYRKRHIFWEWMVSVVEEEFKTQGKQLSVGEISHLHEFLRKLKSDVQKASVTEDEIPSDKSITPVITRRMCLTKNCEDVDSMIETMNLKINKLKLDNENKIKKITSNLRNSGNQYIVINEILKSFCNIEGTKKEILTRLGSELCVDNLNKNKSAFRPTMNEIGLIGSLK